MKISPPRSLFALWLAFTLTIVPVLRVSAQAQAPDTKPVETATPVAPSATSTPVAPRAEEKPVAPGDSSPTAAGDDASEKPAGTQPAVPDSVHADEVAPEASAK